MNKINHGGPAFPMQEPQAIHAHAIASIEGVTDLDERDRLYTLARAAAVGGMSLRDYFAAKAMQGFSQTVRDLGGADQAVARGEFDVCARFAYMLADAMLKARGAT